ncbi:Uncharacterised protein [Clostridioides difficile]|nr:hypothetical protein [Clostridioides difficile]MCA0595231.1 hypothetical protein [Clostridioides difficile]MCE4889232.1 hypothetical protein [Clostridioides difficile]MCR1667231.1 hypothetical protein [Clostridioides difficile]MCW0914875.1 hypothetical protein [Clostridioides difficile]
MCEYCEVKINTEPFSMYDTVVRGELLTNDSDIDMYIEFKDKKYFITGASYDYLSINSKKPIKYCPFCGQKLI